MSLHAPRMPEARAGELMLVSHARCPYVQRAAIVAREKEIPLRRVTIDLAAKPDWFIALSPTGKVPMLLVGDTALFESAAIAEFLDEISPGAMLPADPIERARHRAWIEFASGTLAGLGTLYNAPDQASYEAAAQVLRTRFARLAEAIQGLWFAGTHFGLVDAAFAPVFRYLDTLEAHAGLELMQGTPALHAWRAALAERESVRLAVTEDYPARLLAFLQARRSFLGRALSPKG